MRPTRPPGMWLGSGDTPEPPVWGCAPFTPLARLGRFDWGDGWRLADSLSLPRFTLL